MYNLYKIKELGKRNKEKNAALCKSLSLKNLICPNLNISEVD
jgi:hypothetical protein